MSKPDTAPRKLFSQANIINLLLRRVKINEMGKWKIPRRVKSHFYVTRRSDNAHEPYIGNYGITIFRKRTFSSNEVKYCVWLLIDFLTTSGDIPETGES